MQPREVVKDLIGLAGSSARDTKADRAKVFNSAKVEFRQAKFSGTQVQSIRNRIVTCIERAEGRSIPAVTKPNFVNLGWAKCRKKTRRQDLNARRRGL